MSEEKKGQNREEDKKREQTWDEGGEKYIKWGKRGGEMREEVRFEERAEEKEDDLRECSSLGL